MYADNCEAKPSSLSRFGINHRTRKRLPHAKQGRPKKQACGVFPVQRLTGFTGTAIEARPPFSPKNKLTYSKVSFFVCLPVLSSVTV